MVAAKIKFTESAVTSPTTLSIPSAGMTNLKKMRYPSDGDAHVSSIKNTSSHVLHVEAPCKFKNHSSNNPHETLPSPIARKKNIMANA